MLLILVALTECNSKVALGIDFRFAGEKMELSFSNMKRIMEAVMPCENLEQLYTKGYQHTDDFIRSSH